MFVPLCVWLTVVSVNRTVMNSSQMHTSIQQNSIKEKEREREGAAVNESTAAKEVHRSASHHHSPTQQCYIKPAL